jgi:hypothetical protein
MMPSFLGNGQGAVVFGTAVQKGPEYKDIYNS